MTGLFYILCALGIVFVVWGYANEDKLIAFEDKIVLKLRRRFKKQSSRKSAPRVVDAKKAQRAASRPARMPRTAA